MVHMISSFLLLLCIQNVLSKPEQVVLSYLGDPTTMAVTWITMKPLKDGSFPYVNYGTTTKLTSRVNATVTAWTDQGVNQITRWTYRATMTGLSPGRTYYYEVGSSQSTLGTFNFVALDPTKKLKVCIYGDLGHKDGFSTDPLIEAVQEGDFDFVVHLGDIAYSLDDNDGTVGDNFMKSIQNFTAFVPFLVIPGNHETPQNFSHFINRFTNPRNGIIDDNQFWSFTLGDVHFVGLSTEYYGMNISSLAQAQYNWLLNDLKKNKATWTVAFMHRPMYCSNTSKKGCQDYENLVTRDGYPGFPALEPLLNSAGVDLVFWGHKHTYERSWPVAKSIVYNAGQTLQHYHNSSTPVYIMSGAAGTHDHTDPSQKIAQPYTALMLGEYGYSVLDIISGSQVQTSFVDALGVNGNVDPFTLTKDYGYKPGGSFKFN